MSERADIVAFRVRLAGRYLSCRTGRSAGPSREILSGRAVLGFLRGLFFAAVGAEC